MNPILKSNKQLLAILEDQIKDLEKKQAIVDANAIPSQGRAYFYRANFQIQYLRGGFFAAPGVQNQITIDQDTAFVATDLYFRTVINNPDEFSSNSPCYVTITQMSSGRQLTPVDDFSVYGNLKNPGIPLQHVVPLLGPPQNPQLGYDYNYKLPCEWLLPRGAILQFNIVRDFTDAIYPVYDEAGPPFGLGIQYAGLVDVVLGGYKVVGA